jgi:hypothetical protein
VNRVDDPALASTLERMRAALDERLDAARDLGLLPESELRRRLFPGGEQPVTAPPSLRIESGESGRRVTIEAATPGASVRYRIDGGRWRVYAGPFVVTEGHRLEARAVRYGFAESEPRELRLERAE